MTQTRRRRWRRSSGDSTWPAQEQMPGDSSSHASALNHQLVLTGMTTWMTLWPPNHGLQHMMFIPLYMNLGSEKRQRERQEVRQVMLHHLQHKLVLTGMTTWMTSCPPKPWPPTHDVPPPVHERRSRKERKGKPRGSSSHTTPPAAPSVNWDDDLDNFMP